VNATITALPTSGYAPTNVTVAKWLREVADTIEESDECYGRIVVVTEIDGTVSRLVAGGANSRIDTIGLLAIATSHAIAELRE
jgi:hypothetical protein